MWQAQKHEGREKASIKASITNSNNNWETFILQQSLKRFLKSKSKVWIQLNILTSFLDKKQLVSWKQFSIDLYHTPYLYCLNSKKQSSIQVIWIRHWSKLYCIPERGRICGCFMREFYNITFNNSITRKETLNKNIKKWMTTFPKPRTHTYNWAISMERIWWDEMPCRYYGFHFRFSWWPSPWLRQILKVSNKVWSNTNWPWCNNQPFLITSWCIKQRWGWIKARYTCKWS